MEDQIMEFIATSIKNHPMQWLQVYRLFTLYDRKDMQNPQIVGEIVDSLCTLFGLNLTVKRRSSTIQWLIKQQIDPKHARNLCSLFLQSITEPTH